jgi:hypothetical protein
VALSSPKVMFFAFPVIALLLLILLVLPVFSTRPGAVRSRFFVVVLDVASSLGSVACGLVVSCLLAYCCPVFQDCFFILLCFSFVFELGALYVVLSVCNCLLSS